MGSNSDSLKFNRPKLFSPTVIHGVITEPTNIKFEESNFVNSSDITVGDSGTFKYDLPETGIKSTQQLNIDWENFENHTFFNSARVKVQTTFDKIINQFPFDGTKIESELFFDNLTGYEKYVYDQLPKYKGYLFLSGTNGETSGGTYVTVKDVAGADYPVLSRNTQGISVLDPGLNSITIEFQLYLPKITNSNQCILQKISGSSAGTEYGINVSLQTTGSTTTGSITMSIVSGSTIQSASFNVTKGQFNHIAFVWDRNPQTQVLNGYLNHNLLNSSSAVEMSSLSFQSAPLYIGSGSTINITNFTPTNTLSGVLDELRIWHTNRNLDDRRQYEKKAVFANDDLKLYFKFNEPSGSNSNLVLDSSSNSLHGVLSSWATNTAKVRNFPTSSIAGSSSMTYEKLDNSPILFPDHPGMVSIRTVLLSSASIYDQHNPNLITRLLPNHYLNQGQEQDGTSTEEGSIVDSNGSEGIPRTNKLGDTQLLLSLLWTWAKFFDEIKLYTQAFGDLLHVDYNEIDTVPDHFLQFLANQSGFTLPPLFNGSSLEQFIEAENLDHDINTGSETLQNIQNQIWKRILLNLRDITSSKGTIHSVKSFIRTLGIDPDNNFRIREFGGPTKKALSESRETKTEISTMLNFVSGGYIRSPYLSGSRTEPGFPITSSFTADSGLWTTGSWTYEAHYRLPIGSSSSVQNLARFLMTGSGGATKLLIGQLVASSGSVDWFFNPGYYNYSLGVRSSDINLNISASIFDNYPWYVSVGRTRNDQLSSSISSSYFLRVAKTDYEGKIIEAYSSSVFLNDLAIKQAITINPAIIDSTQNASGVFIEIGQTSQNLSSIAQFSSSYVYNITPTVLTGTFQGKVSHIRFWTKSLEEKEWREHVRNFKSLGVQNQLINFNFATAPSGSWERLRMDISTDQQSLSTDSSGRITLFDFSQNNQQWSGSLFPLTSSVIIPQRFYYSYISPKFDEAVTVNKIRARSFLDVNNIISNDAGVLIATAPLYELERSEEPTDSTKFTIDFSIVDALNQDIINMFSTLESFNQNIGAPELMFSSDYPKLEELRNLYFKRLQDQINLKSLFEFYKWFSVEIGGFISQLIPRKTKYLGTNYCIESHMLERSKIEYISSDAYVGDSMRDSTKGVILLQQFVGTMQKI